MKNTQEVYKSEDTVQVKIRPPQKKAKRRKRLLQKKEEKEKRTVQYLQSKEDDGQKQARNETETRQRIG